MTEVVLEGQQLQLLPEKAVYWPNEKILFISDLHLGKVMHFRKAGIAVPNNAGLHNFKRLNDLIEAYRPQRLIFLGDLFHSEKNRSWDVFCHFRDNHRNTEFELVVGNHDILDQKAYQEAGLTIHQEGKVVQPFYLSHHPDDISDYFNLCGHIHPGIRIRGKARQSIKLPCFWVRPRQMVLPAFGTFTGVHVVTPADSEVMYAIANREILKIEQ